MRARIVSLLIVCVMLATTMARAPRSVVVASPAQRSAPTQPTQPATGPGGAATDFDDVTVTKIATTGPGAWIVTPVGPRAGVNPSAPLPVVLFLGGCCMPDYLNAPMDVYRAWIEHLARRGAIVIFPAYRALYGGLDVLTAVRVAAALPAARSRPPLDWSRMAIVAHSYGGVLALGYAESATTQRTPIPRALMLAMPGCVCDLPTDLRAIAPTTKTIMTVGIADTVVGSDDARTLWASLTSIPRDQRLFVTFWSDHHGDPPLIADHAVAVTNSADGIVGTVDAFDWYGTWKLADALIDCAFTGQTCDVALGNGAAEQSMGTWSDGVPVAELRVTDDPATPGPTPTSSRFPSS